jgi:hypothetical protein
MVRRKISAGAIVPGTPLVTAADGLTGKLTAGTLGAEGDVVAIGAESVGDSTAVVNVVANIQLNPLDKATA